MSIEDQYERFYFASEKILDAAQGFPDRLDKVRGPGELFKEMPCLLQSDISTGERVKLKLPAGKFLLTGQVKEICHVYKHDGPYGERTTGMKIVFETNNSWYVLTVSS